MTLYDQIGRNYAARRRPDPRIAAAIAAALGDAQTVLNVGAGAGSYEPPDRTVLAVEPSALMIRQRPPGSAPCRQGAAEHLPVETASVAAAMAVLSIHHWTDLDRGLREMRRVARKRVVLVTWVPDSPPFWLTADYFPEIAAHDRTIFPRSTELAARLGPLFASFAIAALPVPHDCSDGFLGAYWRRPDAYLHAETRAAISSFARIDPAAGLASLRADLASGRWRERNRQLEALEALDLGYRVVTCEVGG